VSEIRWEAERIKKRRLELRYSQKQLAEKIGTTQGAVAQMETGIRSPSATVLPRLAKALRVSVDYLLVGEAAEMLDVGGLDAGDRHLLRRFRDFLLWEKKGG